MASPLQPEVAVNGETIPPAAIAAEAQMHPAPPGKPGLAWRAAARALAVRALLRQEASRAGLRAQPRDLGEGRRDDALVASLLDGAAAARGWLILTTHDVAPAPTPFGCTAETLSFAIAGARARGMDVLTLSDALDACGLPARGPA